MKLCTCKKILGICLLGVVIVLALAFLSNSDTKVSTSSLLGFGRSKLNSIWMNVDQNDHNSNFQIKQVRIGHRGKKAFKNQNVSVVLPRTVIDRVETFVFFIGYPRSGHSIVGSLMDAHPNMIIAHEFMLFKQWIQMEKARIENGTKNLLTDKNYLFNALYHDSYRDATRGLRSQNKDHKGYSLDGGFPWQGRFDRELLVIGDKSGGMTTFTFMGGQQRFKEHYQQLLDTVNMPVKVIHVVRNPYDIISTEVLYSAGKRMENVKAPVFVAKQKVLFKNNQTRLTARRYNNDELVENKTRSIFKMANAIERMIKYIGPENVLEIHNGNLVKNPKGTLRKICSFLHIKCPKDYLERAIGKVFKKVSKTREVVEWPLLLRERVEERMKKVPFFKRYSFDSDI